MKDWIGIILAVIVAAEVVWVLWIAIDFWRLDKETYMPRSRPCWPSWSTGNETGSLDRCHAGRGRGCGLRVGCVCRHRLLERET